MRMRCAPIVALCLALAVPGPASAGQTQPPPQTPPAAPPATPAAAPKPKPQAPRQAQPPPAARGVALTVMVTALDGKTLPDVLVTATGPVDREASTDPSGLVTLANVVPGTYRLRFEREGFITFEKEVAIAGKPLRASASLSAAPAPPPEPPKPETPAPPPAVADGNYSANTLSLPDFIENNYIGSAQIKRSPVGCAASSTSTLVQTKEPIADHTHADADETLYIVAGEGTLRVGGRDTPLVAASFAVIPRGTAHTITRRGSRPLIFVSTLSGAPCTAGQK